jgi:AraC family transcriptional regulator of adaptative response/methylated-DNA-[protein]-cysteine methyltransferase
MARSAEPSSQGAAPQDSDRDYERMVRAIAFIAAHVEDQPGLEAVAAHVHLSPWHFQRLFSRWVGTTPKRFLQVLTVERAKRLLQASRPLLEVAAAVGLSGASRLHDHCVSLEAMSPGEVRAGGAGLTLEYGIASTPFGPALVGFSPRGLCCLEFLAPGEQDEAPQCLARRWPRATLRSAPREKVERVERAMVGAGGEGRPLPLCVAGTSFQIAVWKALIALPPGALASYGHLASALGRPGAARAVGRAVGHNPVAVLIPCHRVIRETGGLGGYRWGLPRKQALLSWEAARTL